MSGQAILQQYFVNYRAKTIPFAKGQSGNPAGRPKGAKNRRTREIEAILESYDYDPIESLILFATNAREKLGLDQDVSPELRFQAAKEICQYMQPKLRSTDLNVTVRDDPVKKMMDEIAGHSRQMPLETQH